MKISEAMRRGARLGPQLFNHGVDSNGGTCAYWAMVKGSLLGVENTDVLYMKRGCPVKDCDKSFTNGSTVGVPNVMYSKPQSVIEVIVHLNNDHRWTRECIAGWIEATFEGGIPSKDIMEMIGKPEQEAVCMTDVPRAIEHPSRARLFPSSEAKFGRRTFAGG